MKQFFFSFIVVFSLCCCKNTSSNQIIIFLEEATQRMEKATSPNEVKGINDKLIKNISIYSMSLQPEEYRKWANDPTIQAHVEAAKMEYKKTKQNKEKELKGEL